MMGPDKSISLERAGGGGGPRCTCAREEGRSGQESDVDADDCEKIGV